MQHSFMLTSLLQRWRELCCGPTTARQLVMMDLLKDAAPALLDENV